MDLGQRGKVALVAGGGRGIGAAVAEGLAREGARVAVLSRTQGEVERLAAGIAAGGAEALALTADLLDHGALDAALDRLRTTWGPPAIVVHAASALFSPQKLHNVTDEQADQAIRADLGTAVALARRCLPDMMLGKWGRVVLIGSLVATTATRGGALYTAAKAGLEGLARGVALDYARYGVTCNVVRPGFVDTERFAQRTRPRPGWRDELCRHVPTGHITRPEEVAAAVLFLASDGAAAITGTALDVTGGSHLNTLW